MYKLLHGNKYYQYQITWILSMTTERGYSALTTDKITTKPTLITQVANILSRIKRGHYEYYDILELRQKKALQGDPFVWHTSGLIRTFRLKNIPRPRKILT